MQEILKSIIATSPKNVDPIAKLANIGRITKIKVKCKFNHNNNEAWFKQ